MYGFQAGTRKYEEAGEVKHKNRKDKIEKTRSATFRVVKCDFLAAILPQRPFLIKLLQTVEGPTWHPDEAARC